MDNAKAQALIAALANGINPLTGEVFPVDSPYQSPDVVRALFAAGRALESKARARPRGSQAANAGKIWSDDDERQLLSEFDAGRTLPELAQSLGRSLAGIQARLEKNGRLQPPATDGAGTRQSFRFSDANRASGSRPGA